MKNIFKPLVKRILIPFGLIAAVPGTDATIQKKIHRSRHLLDLARQTHHREFQFHVLSEKRFSYNCSKNLTRWNEKMSYPRSKKPTC